MSDNKVAITVDQLKDLLTEMRKPVVTEAEVKAEKERQEDRKRNAEEQLQIMRNEAAFQAACSHLRRDGSNRTVNVNQGEYLLCQMCRKVIRPETDPALYNRFIQMGSLADV